MFDCLHGAFNNRNNVKTAKPPNVGLEFARRSFLFQLGGLIFNSLPLSLRSLRNINSRVLFAKAMDDYYL